MIGKLGPMNRTPTWVFSFILCLLPGLGFGRGEEITVHILSQHNPSQVQIRSLQGPLEIQGGKSLRIRSEESVQLKKRNNLLVLENLQQNPAPTWQFESSGGGLVQISLPDGQRFSFPGTLQVNTPQGELRFILQLPLEDYVLWTLASELPEDFPVEALKAQAVAIRSFALAEPGRHRNEGFQFCDLTHCQHFRGQAQIHPRYQQAIRQTRGQILTYRGQVAQTLYHSTCGGHTSSNQAIFAGRPRDYLQGVSDDGACVSSPHFRWQSELSLENLTDVIGSPVTQVQILSRDSVGRVKEVQFRGSETLRMSADQFLRRMGTELGWGLVKSAWFDWKLSKGKLFIQGKGLGHGVGLCQWGARGMALAGQDYRQILATYFPGTQIQTRAGSRP